MSMKFADEAHWIWLENDQRDKNGYACFRRRFTVSNRNVQTAQLRITADSRYDAFLNGQWIGHGPVRSWPSPWPVDIYDVSHLLRPGENVLSVLVHHFGISTFQYLHDEPGLLAQLSYEDASQQLDVVTDHRWRCTPHEGYGNNTRSRLRRLRRGRWVPWRSGAGSVFWLAEDSPRGLGRTLGKRVGIKPSRVRISYPPPS